MVLQVRYKDTMTKREMNINSTVKASETAPATLLREEQEAAMTGGVDYSRMKEITQDMMTDELFAAVQRGDAQMVHGMTSAVNPKARRPSSLIGAMSLVAETKKHHQRVKSSKSRRRNSKLGVLADAGLMAQLMFETNGNEELARLLLTKLKANTLMAMDGNYADDIARDMGAYGLSENIRQIQREEQSREKTYQDDAEHAAVEQSKFLTAYSYAPKETPAAPEPVVSKLCPEQAAKQQGMLERLGGQISNMTGLTKVFGMFNNKGPVETALISRAPAVAYTMPKMAFNMAPAMA